MESQLWTGSLDSLVVPVGLLHSDLSACFLPLPTEQRGFLSCLPNRWSRPGFRSLLDSGESLSQLYYLATEGLNTQPPSLSHFSMALNPFYSLCLPSSAASGNRCSQGLGLYSIHWVCFSPSLVERFMRYCLNKS